jgi:hypothetical protein
MTTFTDGTPNPVILSAATTPFTAITANDTPGTLETINITLYPYYYYNYYYGSSSNGSYLGNSNFTNLGTISDPNGGGTYNSATHTFTEQVLVTGTPTEGTKLIQRLVYTPPALQAGNSNIISAWISVNGTTDFVGPTPPPSTQTYSTVLSPYGSVLLETVTPPSIQGAVANIPVASPTSTAPATVRPFATVGVADSNFYYSPKLTATITLTDGGVPTDADGLLTGTGLSKSTTQAGVYNFSNYANYSLQSYLSGLTFTPTAVADNTSRTTSFELNVTDNGFPGLTADDKTTSVLVLGKIVGPVPPAPPLIAGTTSIAVVPGNIIQPFANVTVSDQNANPRDSATITIDVPGGGVLSGPGVGVTSPTTYVIPRRRPTNSRQSCATSTSHPLRLATPAQSQATSPSTFQTRQNLARKASSELWSFRPRRLQPLRLSLPLRFQPRPQPQPLTRPTFPFQTNRMVKPQPSQGSPILGLSQA